MAIGTCHRITHLSLADAGASGCARHAITASSDRSVRIWDVYCGLLVAVLHMPHMNCRTDALCHCGAMLVLVGIVRHLQQPVPSASEDSESDPNHDLDSTVPALANFET